MHREFLVGSCILVTPQLIPLSGRHTLTRFQTWDRKKGPRYPRTFKVSAQSATLMSHIYYHFPGSSIFPPTHLSFSFLKSQMIFIPITFEIFQFTLAFCTNRISSFVRQQVNLAHKALKFSIYVFDFNSRFHFAITMTAPNI